MIATAPVVLVASALLVWPQDEPGADRVAQALGHGALMSAINWSKVLSKLADRAWNRLRVPGLAVELIR